MLWGVVIASACQTARPAYDYAREPDPRHSEYTIGAADVLKIHVWKDAELSSQVTVRPDGTVTLPLLGELRAAGQTPSQLTREVTRRLAKFVREENAVVSVAVVEVNSYRYTVLGNVAQPGIFSPRYYVTITQAVAMAGGPTPFANLDATTIIRSDDQGRQRKIPINLDSLRKGERLEQNLVLLAGDTVLVP
jgi:polysaccharide export outer membrane protein